MSNCHICNGVGCQACTAVVIAPVCKEVEIDKLIKLLQILDKAKFPTVTFCENIERMRKEAAKISEVNLHDAIVMLNDMVAE